jgi:hypothetical protein
MSTEGCADPDWLRATSKGSTDDSQRSGTPVPAALRRGRSGLGGPQVRVPPTSDNTEVSTMLRFKLGALIGFGIGWAVGSGRAAEFWNDFRGTSRPQAGPRPTETVTSGMTTRREAAAGS